MATGRAGAAAQKAKQERLLEQLQAAKESFRLGLASIPPKGVDSKVSAVDVALQQQKQ